MWNLDVWEDKSLKINSIGRSGLSMLLAKVNQICTKAYSPMSDEVP